MGSGRTETSLYTILFHLIQQPDLKTPVSMLRDRYQGFLKIKFHFTQKGIVADVKELRKLADNYDAFSTS